MRVFTICAFAMLFSPVLHAESFCSLIVKLVDESGALTGGPVTVEERSGRRLEVKDSEPRRDGVKFCDLGILPVNVTVGHPGCNQVVVRDVRLTWGLVKNLVVTYDKWSCSLGDVLPPTCRFLFRFVDPANNPIASVSFKMMSPRDDTFFADQFGRISMVIPYNKQLAGSAVSPGHVPLEIVFPCTSPNDRMEKTLTMQRTQ